MAPQTPQRQQLEEGMRESLRDLLPLVQGLRPLCDTVDELIGVVSLALENDAQLRMLLNQITPQQGQRR